MENIDFINVVDSEGLTGYISEAFSDRDWQKLYIHKCRVPSMI